MSDRKIKSITLTKLRLLTILEIAKQLGVNNVQAVNVLNDIRDGKYLGENLEDHWWLEVSDFFIVETATIEEVVEETAFKIEAIMWRENLSDTEKEYLNLLIQDNIPTAQ